jgi:hypothetical protein
MMRDLICETYPELADDDYKAFWDGTIELRDDSDGEGVYIDIWNYHQPIPAGLKLGK